MPDSHWMILTQPIGFVVALIGLMGKLELPPFDAPEAETEIVAGALTEYSGRGLALFRLGKDVELVLGLTLVAAFYLGGLHNPLDFLLKTLRLAVHPGRSAVPAHPLAHRPGGALVALRRAAGPAAVAGDDRSG